MKTVEEIRHDGLPDDYHSQVQAKVHVYTDTETTMHCFGSLRTARAFIANIRKKRFRLLKGPDECENPPPNTYLVWVKPGANVE